MAPDVYWASRIARGPQPGPRPVGHGIVKRGSHDRHVDGSATELRWIGDPWQVHERRWPDVGREIEVGECLERVVPAVAGREVALEFGVGALGHGILRRRSRRAAAGLLTISLGRRRFRTLVQRGARTDRSIHRGRRPGGPFARCRLRALAHAPWVRSFTCSPPPSTRLARAPDSRFAGDSWVVGAARSLTHF
jgi:hypothetical protein